MSWKYLDKAVHMIGICFLNTSNGVNCKWVSIFFPDNRRAAMGYICLGYGFHDTIHICGEKAKNWAPLKGKRDTTTDV